MGYSTVILPCGVLQVLSGFLGAAIKIKATDAHINNTLAVLRNWEALDADVRAVLPTTAANAKAVLLSPHQPECIEYETCKTCSEVSNGRGGTQSFC